MTKVVESPNLTIVLEDMQDQLQGFLKPFQQQQNQRHKKIDFLKQCIRSIGKNDFFFLDELLKSKQAEYILEDPNFRSCEAIFTRLKEHAEKQVDNYRIKFKNTLLELAEEADIPVKVDLPRISFLKGIEGEVDFEGRKTTINKITLKSLDPRRIISAAVKKKRQLYDKPYDPQNFIDGLFRIYFELIKDAKRPVGETVSIRQLYKEYVWSLQSKVFFQNMEKGKFKGYSIEQFSVDLWRYFQAGLSGTNDGYCIKLSGGRGSAFWLIDRNGERRQITQVSFSKL